MACETLLNTGRTVVISWADEDCEATPLTTATTPIASWEVIGAVQSFNENFTQRTTTANVEGQAITITETLGGDLEITVTSLDVADVASASSQQALRNKIFAAALADTPETPKGWIRLWDKAISEYRYYYCMLDAPSRSGEVEGNRTAEFTFTAVPTNQPSNPSFQRETITP